MPGPIVADPPADVAALNESVRRINAYCPFCAYQPRLWRFAREFGSETPEVTLALAVQRLDHVQRHLVDEIAELRAAQERTAAHLREALALVRGGGQVAP